MSRDLNCLGAFTEPTHDAYPPYVAVSHDKGLDMIVIGVRAPMELREAVAIPGAYSAMILEPEEFARLIGDIIKNSDEDIKTRIQYAIGHDD